MEIQSIAAARLDLDREIKASDELVGDLGLDSLALITLAVTLEERFEVALAAEDSTQVRTVADLCRVVARVARARC